MVADKVGTQLKDYPAENLIEAFQTTKALVLKGLDESFVQDIAFIGNASDIYPWEPAMIIDLDVAIFVDHLNDESGQWLRQLSREIEESLALRQMDFELRIVRGPYKATQTQIDRPFMVLHGAVFTEETYLEESELMRWGWKKYTSEREPGRLARLAPPKPDIELLLNGAKGIARRLSGIQAGEVQMQERVLPSLQFVTHQFGEDHPLFAEYCLTAGATTARNHARVLGHAQADYLANREFFSWYLGEVFPSEALKKLVAEKARVRNQGYAGLMPRVRQLAIAYLTSLQASLVSHQLKSE